MFRELIRTQSDDIDEMFSFEIIRGDEDDKVLITIKKLDIRMEFDVARFDSFATRIAELREKLLTPRRGTH